MSSPILYEPRARWGHGAVEVKGRVYIWGGEDSDGNPYPASLIEVFNIRTGDWEQQNARGVGPIGVIYSAYTTIGEKLYTFSGRGKGRTYYNTLHQLNLKTMKWKKLTSRNPSDAPTPRRGCTMISYGNDKLVTFGGYDASNKYSNTLHLFNLRAGIWSKCQVSGDSEIPLPTGYGTFLRVDEFKAILFGGATREGRRNDTYCLIMPKHLSDPWKWIKQQIPSGSSICPGRSGHAASVVKYKKDKVKGVLIYGGLQDTDTYNTPLNDAWFLDLSRNDFTLSSWKQIKLPIEIEARCDSTISVISSSTSQSAHVLLYGGQHKWAQQTVAETTLMILFTSGKREMTIVDCAMIADAVKWNERVLRLQTLDKLKTEMNKGKTVRRKVASVLFIGPPQTGKTTIMKRIQDPELTAPIKSASTPIAEGPIHVAIEKAIPTMALFENHGWTAQSFKEEKSHLLSCTLPSDEPNKFDVSNKTALGTTEDVARTEDTEDVQASNVTTNSKQTRKGLIRGLIRRRRHQQPLARSDSISSVASAVSITFETPEDMYRELLELKNRKPAKGDECISLHLLDTGGQPEFMDILPLLLTCPSLIVLVFNMNTKLTDRYIVEYVSPDGPRAVPYESSFTVEEVLLQTLASVAHSSSVSLPLPSANQPLFEKDRLQSVAVFVGTHLDQVSKEQVEEINDFLTCKVQDVLVPECKIISYNTNTAAKDSLSNRYLFALNNTIPHDPGLFTLRNVLTAVLDEEFGSCDVPHSWLMFYLSVRSAPARILSFQNCRKIAGGCGISDDSELRLTLWFLSSYWGVFRYYPEVPGLQEVVIVDLQILFDAITKLITRAFDLGRQHQVSNIDILIKECGRFPLSELEHLLKSNDFKSHTEISVSHFIQLLEHMHIIASITDDTKRAKEYFFPCILKPYPVERLFVNPEQLMIPPLLVVFESGYCPLGLFNALVLELAKCKTWHMARFSRLNKETRQYRNKLVYYVGETEDRVTLIAHPKFIEIQIERTVKSMKNITQVCCDVRDTIEKSIEQVRSFVAASQENHQQFAFHCHGEHDVSVAAHPAVVQIPESKMELPSYVRCLITERLISLSTKQQLWFGSPNSIEAIESINLEDIDNEELCNDDPDSLHAVLYEVAEVTHWREFGSTLGLEQSTLDHIEAEQDKMCNRIREVIVCWLKRKDSVQAPSWRSLVCALNTGRVNHSDMALKISASHQIK